MIHHDKCEAFEQIIKIKDAKIAELEKKLELACEALRMISCDNIYVGENGWRDEYLLNYKQATEALAAINGEH